MTSERTGAPTGPGAPLVRGRPVSARALRRTLGLVAGVFVIYYLLVPTLVKSRRSAELLTTVNPGLIAAAIAAEIGSLLCYAVLTRVTLPPRPHLSLFTLFRIQLSSKAVGNVMPVGSAAGGTVGFKLLTARGVAAPAAAFSLTTVGLGSAVVLNVLLAVSLVVSIPMNGFRPVYVTAAIIGTLLLGFTAGLVFLLIEGRSFAERALRTVFGRLPGVSEDTGSRLVRRAADQIEDLSRRPSLVRRGISWAVANWLLDAVALWMFLVAFGEVMNPVNLLVAYCVVGIIAAVPLTPGGVGAVEIALPLLLASLGASPAEAGFAVLSWRLVQFWLPIPLGGLAYLSLGYGHRRSPQ